MPNGSERPQGSPVCLRIHVTSASFGHFVPQGYSKLEERGGVIFPIPSNTAASLISSTRGRAMKVGRSCPGTKLLSPGLEHKAIFHLLCIRKASQELESPIDLGNKTRPKSGRKQLRKDH